MEIAPPKRATSDLNNDFDLMLSQQKAINGESNFWGEPDKLSVDNLGDLDIESPKDIKSHIHDKLECGFDEQEAMLKDPEGPLFQELGGDMNLSLRHRSNTFCIPSSLNADFLLDHLLKP